MFGIMRRLREKRRARRGQNLVELVLTLPFLIVVIFIIVEMGRVWTTYSAAKSAAIDGVRAASMTADVARGRDQIINRLNKARVPFQPGQISVVEVPTRGGGAVRGYKARVRVDYRPVFGAISLPTLGAPIVLVPETFPIDYNEVYYDSLY